MKKQCRPAKRLVRCYEAGCFGYVLHRKLEAMGIESLVVRPRDWDEYGFSVKTDARDAGELFIHLDRCLVGNKRALSMVRVPTEQQEQQRSLCRQHETLAKERKRLENIGTSNGLYYGINIESNWWKPKIFEQLKQKVPQYMIAILEPYQNILVVIDRQLREATAREERTANPMLPVGLGALTASVLDREFVDYERFTNRKQVASYTGLCPGESSSGKKRFQGSINKYGNPRIRHMLIEAVWRMLSFRPGYKPNRYWQERMLHEPFTAAEKKRMAAAIARQFAIDWWGIQTGRMSADTVGLKLNYLASYAAQALRVRRISRPYA